MAYGFLDTLATPSIKAAQAANGVGEFWADFSGHRAFNRFTENEIVFIGQRDSFYMATVTQNGWPYVQHRGGPAGFLRVLDEQTLAFADFRGNRQYLTVGNLGADDRVALLLVDYPGKQRLKILAHAELRDLKNDPDLAARLALPGYKAKVERAMVLKLETFDWNCPQHITPRFTESEIAEALEPMRERIATLEAENRSLRQRSGLVARDDH